MYILRDEWENFQVVPCSILAHWVPVTIWLNPSTDNLVYPDSPAPSDIFKGPDYRRLDKTTQIVIPSSWTAAIDSINASNPRPLEWIIRPFGLNDSSGVWTIAGGNTIPWEVASALGLLMADLLARVNYMDGPNGTIVVHDPGDGGGQIARVLDDINSVDLPFPPGYDTPMAYYEAHRDTTTAFEIEVQRFGYAWSASSVTIKLAATVLLLHAALAVGHLVVLSFSGWTSNSWKSAGELLAGGVRKDGSQRLKNAGGGINRKNTWRGLVRVRANGVADDLLELLVDEETANSTTVELQEGRAYS